jgi:dTDP-4-amino-4,6-dideoxygalactose transaminase
MIKRFEDEFCKYTGFKAACAVSSGTAAIHLALILSGVKFTDLVISSTMTFIGGVYPILYQKAAPRFIDCDESFTIDPQLLEEELENLSRRHYLPQAVILTDLYGQCCDMEKCLEICARYNINVIVDACESLGAKVYDKHAGKGANFAAFSFNGNKIMTTSGGGMLASDDEELIEQARNLSQQASEPGVPFYNHERIGFNYRMSNVLAAIGVAQLHSLDEKIEKKREIFNFYKNSLRDIPEITFMIESEYNKSTRWLTVMLFKDGYGRFILDLKNFLEEKNIESRLVFKPMHLQPIFMEKELVTKNYISEDLFSSGLCLPSGTGMTQKDLERVCEAIKEFWRK